ncbi:hypothetical protein BDEG_23241 [Batrachochytrium dendrobatidis JEL423]|uniref:Uncharacterized protein n=1 Tax=Batrachochytrium dendrobatidis (strain JEL423) TaxID=403673 RepID=A0A177WIS0_BATDL|nr:hypothetical protein BDEG_23241 [Batrachochytrium dendrobatidis JEL423]
MADSPNVAASRTAAGIRRRLAAQKASSSSASNRPATQPGSMMRIYMDDSPGVKVYVILSLYWLEVLLLSHRSLFSILTIVLSEPRSLDLFKLTSHPFLPLVYFDSP